MSKKPKIIILGAGMSGIACALSLYKNFDVQIYEKSRGIGGRLCAKRLPHGVFHFGAQFCTAHTTTFQNFLTYLSCKNPRNEKKLIGREQILMSSQTAK